MTWDAGSCGSARSRATSRCLVPLRAIERTLLNCIRMQRVVKGRDGNALPEEQVRSPRCCWTALLLTRHA